MLTRNDVCLGCVCAWGVFSHRMTWSRLLPRSGLLACDFTVCIRVWNGHTDANASRSHSIQPQSAMVCAIWSAFQCCRQSIRLPIKIALWLKKARLVSAWALANELCSMELQIQTPHKAFAGLGCNPCRQIRACSSQLQFLPPSQASTSC